MQGSRLCQCGLRGFAGASAWTSHSGHPIDNVPQDGFLDRLQILSCKIIGASSLPVGLLETSFLLARASLINVPCPALPITCWSILGCLSKACRWGM